LQCDDTKQRRVRVLQELHDVGEEHGIEHGPVVTTDVDKDFDEFVADESGNFAVVRHEKVIKKLPNLLFVVGVGSMPALCHHCLKYAE
jgi:hypothetical protein